MKPASETAHPSLPSDSDTRLQTLNAPRSGERSVARMSSPSLQGDAVQEEIPATSETEASAAVRPVPKPRKTKKQSSDSELLAGSESASRSSGDAGLCEGEENELSHDPNM